MLRTKLRVPQSCEDNMCSFHMGLQFGEKQDTCRAVSENLRISFPDGTPKIIYIYCHKFLLMGKFLKVIYTCHVN